MTACTFCGTEINPNSKDVWHRVEGWERKGKSGGSDIALRKPLPGEYACATCVRRQQQGLAPLQRALL